MSVETVIAIVTAIIAFCTSVASFTYNLIQNRKNRIQKIILDNRIRYMNEIREGFTNFIGLTNVKAINLAKSNADITANFTQKLFYGYGKNKNLHKAVLRYRQGAFNCFGQPLRMRFIHTRRRGKRYKFT